MTERAKRNECVVAWGEIVWDLFPEGRRLGGCAANVAFHLARLGVPVRLVSRVGVDVLGSEAIGQLHAAGVNVDLVQLDPDHPTGTVAVEIRAGEPRFAIATEAAWDRIAWDEALAQATASASVLYYGTLAQRTPLGSGTLRQAWAATTRDCVRVCDVNLRHPFPSPSVVEASLRAADIVKLNQRELTFLANLCGVADPVRWLVREVGVSMVALTLGQRGCVLALRDVQVEHAGFAVSEETGDSVGAGDAFTAVLCASLASGRLPRSTPELRRLAERANRIASYVASRPGATPELPDSLLTPGSRSAGS